MQQKLTQKAMNMVKTSDLIHKGFLKPMQIALKTNETQFDWPNKDEKLAKGLKLVLKKDGMSSNKYQLLNIDKIPKIDYQYNEFINKNYNNLLSILKSSQGIDIAICVCMSKEQKRMLKTTLAGIGQNIEHFVHNGISADKIAIFIMIDGIQQVHKTIDQYFEQLERQSDIEFNQDLQPLNISDLIKNEKKQLFGQPNINNLLFDQIELQQRKSRRFINRKNEYLQVKKLKNQIEQYKTNKFITYHELSSKIQQFYIQKAQKQQLMNQQQPQKQKKLNTEQIISKYAYNNKLSRPIILNALKQAQRYCDQYFQKRQDLSYVSIFRTGIFIQQQNFIKLEKKKKSQQHQSLVQQKDQTLMKKVNINLIFCVNYSHNGKVQLHNWFFNGFCQELQPKHTFLLDIGVKPSSMAIFNMYYHLEDNPKVGAVCGYMNIKLQQMQDQQEEFYLNNIDFLSSIILKFVSVQRTQQIQSHFEQIIDKSYESAHNYIYTMPSNFVGYNYKALQSSQTQILKDYYKSIDKIQKTDLSIIQMIFRVILPNFMNNLIFGEISNNSQQQLLYNENIYKSQNYLLNLFVYKNGWDLKYLPNVYAQMDPKKTIHDLMDQRKNWINGSQFAFYKFNKQQKLNTSEQNNCQLCLKLQFLYLRLNRLLFFLMPSFFLFFLHIVSQFFSTEVLDRILNVLPFITNTFTQTIDFIYILMLTSLILFSMHFKCTNKRFIPYLYIVITGFGIISIIIVIIFGVDIIRGLLTNQQFLNSSQSQSIIVEGVALQKVLRLAIPSIIGFYLLPLFIYSILYGNTGLIGQLIFGIISFIFFKPTYFIVMQIYAICRIDDVNESTKRMYKQQQENKRMKSKWKLIKILHVCKFVLCNVIMTVIILHLANTYISRFQVTFALIGLIGIFIFFKVLITIVYLITNLCNKQYKDQQSQLQIDSKIDSLLEEMLPLLRKEVNNNILNIAKQIKQQSLLNGSYITFNAKNPKQIRQALQNHEKIYQNQSYIIKKNRKQSMIQKNISNINKKQKKSKNQNQNEQKLFQNNPSTFKLNPSKQKNQQQLQQFQHQTSSNRIKQSQQQKQQKQEKQEKQEKKKYKQNVQL